jgi:hypothetical protein
MPILPARFADAIPWFKPSAPVKPAAPKFYPTPPAIAIDLAAGASKTAISVFEFDVDGTPLLLAAEDFDVDHWQAFAIAAGAHEGGEA